MQQFYVLVMTAAERDALEAAALIMHGRFRAAALGVAKETVDLAWELDRTMAYLKLWRRLRCLEPVPASTFAQIQRCKHEMADEQAA